MVRTSSGVSIGLNRCRLTPRMMSEPFRIRFGKFRPQKKTLNGSDIIRGVNRHLFNPIDTPDDVRTIQSFFLGPEFAKSDSEGFYSLIPYYAYMHSVDLYRMFSYDYTVSIR